MRKLLLPMGVIVAVLAVLVSQRFFVRLDVTRDKLFSVSEYSGRLLSSLTGDLRITYYLTPELRTLYPQTRDIADFLASYAAREDFVSLRIADPQSEHLEAALYQLGVQSQQIEHSVKNKVEFVEVYSALILEYGGKIEVIPYILAAETLEYELDRRLLNLLSDSAPAVYVMTGNTLTSENDYSYALSWLDVAGFSVIVVRPDDFADDLNQFLSPEGLKNPLLVFGSNMLSDRTAASINQFVTSGGNAFFAVSPNTVDLYSEWTVTPPAAAALISLLDSWGFRFGDELVLDISCFRLRLASDDDSAHGQYQYRNYPLWISLLPQFSSRTHATTASFPGMHVFWASPLTLDDTPALSPVLRTSTAAWLMPPDNFHDQVFVTNPFMVAMSGSESGTQGQYIVAAAKDTASSGMLSKNASSRIFVVADQYFAADAMMNYTGASSNLDFLVNVLLWLSGDEELLAVKNIGINTKMLYKKTEDELAAAQIPVLLVTGILLPLVLPLAGAVTVVRGRKRRQRGKPQ